MASTSGPTEQWPAWLAILKISKVTFWFIWVTPLIFGYLNTAYRFSAHQVGWFVFAVVGTCLIESINCIHNELVDQEEDRVNQPRRATLLGSLDQRRLWAAVWVGYLACLTGIALIAAFVSLRVAGFMILAGVCAPLYNAGPRFKRRPGLAELAIGWAVFFGYLAGSTWNAPIGDTSAVIWILTYFFAITSLLKDLPDVAGDEQVNAPGVFSIRRPEVQRAVVIFIHVSPFVLLGAFVIAGLLPVKFLWMFLLLPVAWGVMVLGGRVKDIPTSIVAYELAFLYVHVFFLMLFLIDTPTAIAFGVAVVLFVGRLLSVLAGLAPRFVESDFSWSSSVRDLVHSR